MRLHTRVDAATKLLVAIIPISLFFIFPFGRVFERVRQLVQSFASFSMLSVDSLTRA